MLSYVNDSDTMSKWKSCGEGTQFAAALQRAAQRVAAGLEVIKEWVISLLWPLINQTLTPIFSGLGRLFIPVMNDILNSINASGDNITVDRRAIAMDILKIEAYIGMIGFALFGLGVAIGFLLMTYPIVGAVVLGVLSLGLALYTTHILEDKYKEYIDLGKKVGTSFEAVKEWIESLSEGGWQLAIVISEIFLDLLLAPIATLIAAENEILPEKAVADCFGVFIWAVVISIFGFVNYSNEQNLIAWGMIAVETELLAIGITGYGLAAIIKSARELPKTIPIALVVMFSTLVLASTLALLADIGKVMKGVDQ